MKTTDKAVISELQSLAAQMRETQEQIESGKRHVFERMADLISLAHTQGQNCLVAKTKLGKTLRWSEWLKAHVPTLSEQDAAKYERISTEQLTDPRQCVFAFIGPTTSENEHEGQRLKPAAWEAAAGYVGRLNRVLATQDPTTWPESQTEGFRTALAPIVAKLWPEKFA